MKSSVLKMARWEIQLLAVVFSALLLTGCENKKITFPSSSVIPTADATVTVDKDKNDNYTIDLEAKNMASPERLTPPKSIYLVWIDTENSGIKNIGQLNISDFDGTLKTVTSFKPTRIFITAENDRNIEVPGDQVVLETSVADLWKNEK